MEFSDNKTPQFEFDNIHKFILVLILTNKEELVKVNGYGDIAANDEGAKQFTLFYLHISHIHTKKIWNQKEINWHMVTLFAIKYIHLLEGINHNFMSIHIKNKFV